jgi:hypothetical protein
MMTKIAARILHLFSQHLNFIFDLTVDMIIAQTINSKKLLILQSVVRTQRSHKRVGLKKTAKSFQGLAIYGHEVLISLQTRAKILGTHSTTLVTVSVTRDFNTT